MQGSQLAIGLILCFLVVCHPKVGEAQFFYPQPYNQQPYNAYRQAPRQGSFSKVTNNAYEREVDYGNLELSNGYSNSRAFTRNNGGVSISDTNAISRGANIGGLDVGSTLKRTQTLQNGRVSGGLEHDLNIGNLGIGSSLSRDNLRNGFGLQRDANGGVKLGLGLLNLDLTRNAQQNAPLTQAQVNAQGKNARAKANSNTLVNQQNYGNVGVKETQSQSTAVGVARRGQTSVNGISRVRRAPAPAYRQTYYRPAARRAIAPQRQVSRPKRRAQFIPFGYPQQANFNGFGFERPRRQFQNNRRPSYGGGGFHQQGFGSQNANSQGIANNKGNRFGQQAGANTHSNNEFNENGHFQDNGASSIGSNLANDGSSGQVSSANAAQMNSETADGSSSGNTAQSQSLNFDADQQQATSSNAGTKHTEGLNSERFDANSGSMVTNNNQFGSATNTANTNSAAYENGDTSGALSDASSQSTFQGADGNTAGALTGSKTESIRGPNGFVSNSASSNASATSKGGGNANASASASSSSGADGGNASTNGFAAGDAGSRGGVGGANANSGSTVGNGGAQGFANGFGGYRQREQGQELHIRTTSLRWKEVKQNHPHFQRQPERQTELTDLRHSRYFNTTVTPQPNPKLGHNTSNATEQFDVIDENNKQSRTFSFITDFINSLSGCVYPCTLDAFRQNRCCEVILPPPPVCCQLPQPLPLPPPRPIPLPPPRPPPVIIPPRYPPISCCNTCNIYTYYGPPPCIRYGIGSFGPGSFGPGSFGPGNIGIGNFGVGNIGVGNIGVGNVGTGGILDGIGGLFGNTPRVSIQIPPTYFG